MQQPVTCNTPAGVNFSQHPRDELWSDMNLQHELTEGELVKGANLSKGESSAKGATKASTVQHSEHRAQRSTASNKISGRDMQRKRHAEQSTEQNTEGQQCRTEQQEEQKQSARAEQSREQPK
eukprot:724708-Rhodomonas_salina.1